MKLLTKKLTPLPPTATVERAEGNRMANKRESESGAAVAGAAHGSAETCEKCDWWSLRGAETPPLRVYGYCDLFHKLTESKHGTKCTGWTPANPPNVKISEVAGRK